MNSFFTGLDISINDQSYYDDFFQEREKDSHVQIGIMFTQRRRLVLYTAYVKYQGKKFELIKGDYAEKSTSGQITKDLGYIPHGEEITFGFGILAASAIPEAAIVITQTNPQVGYRLEPPMSAIKPKKLKKSEYWEKKIKYKVQ